MTNAREILRLKSLGLNNTQVASGSGASRTTVVGVLKRAREQGVSWESAADMADKELSRLLFPASAGKPVYKMPDYEYVHREMAKSGVTLSLLWLEYCDRCRESGEVPYKSTQFCKYYGDYVTSTKATMHINRRPGEVLEVDWAGQTAEIVDTDTGEIIPAYVFVAALPYSGYAYVEAFLSRNQENWITAHVNAYASFGGVTRILVPDNLKAFREQAKDNGIAALSFEERFGLLIDAEWAARKSNRLTRLIKNADYAFNDACIEDIEYHDDRKLDKTQISRLATCNYISENHNVIILGATGSGKTYLSNALGMAASRNFYTVKYVRLPDLLAELAVARGEGNYRKAIKVYKQVKLLILDEWLLFPLKETEARDLLEIVEARYNAPWATEYCTDGWSGYINVVYPGRHIGNTRDKSDTFHGKGSKR